jgi:hypothetical protein
MLTVHIASFLKLIDTVLDDTSRGVESRHHLHNVRCEIENLLALLESNYELHEKAYQLSRRAHDYLSYQGPVTDKTKDATMDGDVDRLRVVREALASFSSAVERSKPNSRVRTLGLS